MDVVAAGCSLLPAAEADTAAGPPPHDATICDKTMRTLRLRGLTVVRRRSQGVCHIGGSTTQRIARRFSHHPVHVSGVQHFRPSKTNKVVRRSRVQSAIPTDVSCVACSILRRCRFSWAGYVRAQMRIPEFLRKDVDRAAARIDGVTVAQRFITSRQKCFVECRRVRRRP
jgi:hypothetical protein